MDETQPKKNGGAAALWVGLGVAGGLALYHLIAKMAADTATRAAGGGAYMPPARERFELAEYDF